MGFLIVGVGYTLVAAFYALVILTVIALYLSLCALVFAGTLVAMALRGIFRSQWPQNPRRPSIANRRRAGYDALGRPIQAQWSNRR